MARSRCIDRDVFHKVEEERHELSTRDEEMAKKRGPCLLCGKEGSLLSEDHIQPQCAFNEKHRRHVRMESVQSMAIKQNSTLTGPKFRNIYQEIQPDRLITGGIYRYTQCEDCNGFLGRTYDAHFGEWCRDAVEILKPGQIIVAQASYSQRCRYPLSVLKRVVAMFFSINGDKFAACHPELSRFVMDSMSQTLPERYGVYAAYNINDIVSHIPLQARANVRSGTTTWVSQIAHPPFVYVLTIDSESPDSRLADLRSFAGSAYGQDADIEIVLHLLPTNSCLAGDFRATGKLLPDDIMVGTSDLPPSYFHLVDAVI
jgi:hypothetical protein